MLHALLLPTFLLITSAFQPPAQSAPDAPSPQQTFDPIAVNTDSSQNGNPVCLKMRVYLFERNDGDAPKLVRETTCTTVRPYLHKTKAPKARLIPAN